MRNRPWPLVVLAFVQLLSPAGSIIVSSWLLKMSPLSYTIGLFQLGWPELLSFFAPMPIAAFAIYRTRRWSYPVFLSAILWEMGCNYLEWRAHPEQVPLSLVVALYLIDAALVAYFLLPQVRTVYFDQRVRWWETRPRYEIGLEARIEQGSRSLECRIENLSEGGAFVSMPESLSLDDVTLRFNALSLEFTLPGRIVHVRTANTGQYGYGVEFAPEPAALARLKRFTRGLDRMGLDRRPRKIKPARDFVDWLIPLLKSGKGWVPEVPARAASADPAPCRQDSDHVA